MKEADCMVLAIIDATGREDARNQLVSLRSSMPRRTGQALDSYAEADNLSTLLKAIGEPANIEISIATSVSQVCEIGSNHPGTDVFLGMERIGNDLDHITYLGKGEAVSGLLNNVRNRWFVLDLLAKLGARDGKLYVYIRS